MFEHIGGNAGVLSLTIRFRVIDFCLDGFCAVVENNFWKFMGLQTVQFIAERRRHVATHSSLKDI